jgi:hypothetical protein
MQLTWCRHCSRALQPMQSAGARLLRRRDRGVPPRGALELVHAVRGVARVVARDDELREALVERGVDRVLHDAQAVEPAHELHACMLALCMLTKFARRSSSGASTASFTTHRHLNVQSVCSSDMHKRCKIRCEAHQDMTGKSTRRAVARLTPRRDAWPFLWKSRNMR